MGSSGELAALPAASGALGLPTGGFSDEDLQSIARLRQMARTDLLKWHALLEPLVPHAGRARVKGLTKKLGELAQKQGLTLVTVRRRYDALRKGGWRGLVNRSLTGPTWYHRTGVAALTVAERPAFVDFWQGIMQRYQGRDETGTAAHTALLLRRLKAWESGNAEARIPGYDAPPAREPLPCCLPGGPTTT